MSRHVGLLLIAHHYDDESTDHLRALVGSAGVPSRLAMVGHRASGALADGVAALRSDGCDGVAAVPLFIASASQIVRRFGEETRSAAAAAHVAVALTPALDTAPEVVHALTDRALELADTPQEQAVVLVGHGPSADDDLAAWEHVGAVLAAAVRDRGVFAAARAVVVRDDAEPDVRAAAVRGLRDRVARYAADTGRPVVLVPWVVGAGRLSRDRLPEDLAGLDTQYGGRPLLPHPALDTWLTRRLAAARTALEGVALGGVVTLTGE